MCQIGQTKRIGLSLNHCKFVALLITGRALSMRHKRSRPILMTTIAMGAGMMPLALGWGADPSFRSPMAIAVIGGLITSTLLSLLVVPAVFTYIDDLAQLIGRVMKRFSAPAAD